MTLAVSDLEFEDEFKGIGANHHGFLLDTFEVELCTGADSPRIISHFAEFDLFSGYRALFSYVRSTSDEAASNTQPKPTSSCGLWLGD